MGTGHWYDELNFLLATVQQNDGKTKSDQSIPATRVWLLSFKGFKDILKDFFIGYYI